MDQDSKDANSQLAELDRGLQTQNITDQSDVVSKVTSLFQRHPLPVIIDSACLKLSETFKFCSNFIRIQICEVLEKNQSHLNKIYNVDLFYRNLFTVTTSNDPIARSITLIAFGRIAAIVSNYKAIHHCISDSLDSTFDCELNAAIICASNYVKQSSEFACNIYPRIVSIIDSSKFSVDTKIRALSVLDHGFYNANDALTVRSFLIGVTEQTRVRKLTCACLTLSTKIAFSSLTHIKPQIELLLKTFLDETRLVVRLNALRNLEFLAEKSPHIWETSHTAPLVDFLKNELDQTGNIKNDRFIHSISSIFCKLLTCKCNFISSDAKSQVFAQCYKLAMDHQNLSISSMAFELLSVISEELIYSSETEQNKSNEFSTETFKAIESFVANHVTQLDLSAEKLIQLQPHVKSIFRQIVRLCDLNLHYSPDLLQICMKIIAKNTPAEKISPHFSELMCAIHQTQEAPVIEPSSLLKLIKSNANTMSNKNTLNLMVLYFQAVRLTGGGKISKELIKNIVSNECLWFRYKVMRQAMRYGHHETARLVCESISDDVTSDTLGLYFKSMNRVCSAESIISSGSDLDLSLEKAIPLYEQAVSPLRAAVCNSRLTNFQLQFLYLRTRTLQVHVALRQCCKFHELAPITYATLLNNWNGPAWSGSDLGSTRPSILHQMPKIAKDFRFASDCYENLSIVSFDCDNQTLEYLCLLKSSCTLMADAIDAIFQHGKNLPVLSKLPRMNADERSALEHRELESTCKELIESIKTKILQHVWSPKNESIESLISLLREFSDSLLGCSFIYPRYFFQSLQRTQIKLAITPQPTTSSGTITLTLNNNLVLKVEGLIQDLSANRVVIREVSRVLVSVSLTPAKHTDMVNGLYVQSAATPSNNYFKTEFLLPLKHCGSFVIDIDVSIIDEHERTWRSGPSEKLNLMVS